MAKEGKGKAEKVEAKTKKRISAGKIILIIILLAVAFLLAKKFLFQPPIAKLLIEQGSVEVKDSIWKTAESGMALKEGQSIRTAAGAKASIIFLDGSAILRLDESTEVILANVDKKSISASQVAGKTWSKILKVAGLDSYEIETPTAIAAVRGTAFGIEITDKTDISVVEGEVLSSSYKIENGVKKIITSESLGENKASSIEKEASVIESRKLEENDWIGENKLKDEQFIKDKIESLLKKYSLLTGMIKSTQGWSDEQLRQYATDYVKGKYSFKKLSEEGKIPGILIPLIPEELKRY